MPEQGFDGGGEVVIPRGTVAGPDKGCSGAKDREPGRAQIDEVVDAVH